ncbi:DUF6849 domain-containing protein [Pyrococcus yayanosii]|uniref:Cell division protein 48 (CDC48), domain 2 n=1 Tax=Pyrococcus yayanosii (strain CH1 / JCM 16557) TaxID=529709 RepID=F8AIR2_PYRYC|nr:ATPase [Pyrococcus yayanosii]AEH24029.1 Cell division protein 48 (CDC48), domain 2 [Pyrococcus yayanosii CH1]
MRLVLKPLFDVELPVGFEDILRAKLKGRVVKTGQEIEVDLLGKPLRFQVLYAEPEPLIVNDRTRVEITGGDTFILDIEFDEPVKGVIPFEKGFVIVFPKKVLILNQNGQKIYSDEFEELNEVSVSGDVVVIVHGEKRVRLIKP